MGSKPSCSLQFSTSLQSELAPRPLSSKIVCALSHLAAKYVRPCDSPGAQKQVYKNDRPWEYSLIPQVPDPDTQGLNQTLSHALGYTSPRQYLPTGTPQLQAQQLRLNTPGPSSPTYHCNDEEDSEAWPEWLDPSFGPDR